MAFPKELSAHEAQRYLADGALLVDVRERDEWDEMHVADALLVPLDALDTRAADIPRDRDVIIICRSGRRSGLAQKQLFALGYERVANLTGGILGWHEANFPVIEMERKR